MSEEELLKRLEIQKLLIEDLYSLCYEMERLMRITNGNGFMVGEFDAVLERLNKINKYLVFD